MVGMAIAVFLTAAAVTFASHETRLLGISNDRIEMMQSSRAALDLLASEIRQAGIGVGYERSGDFIGTAGNASNGALMLGQATNADFTIGGTAFGARTIALEAGTLVGGFTGTPHNVITHDIGIRQATGTYATIANYTTAGTGELCDAPNLNFEPAGELVVLRSEDMLAATTVVMNSGGPTPCTWGACDGGCRSFTWALPAQAAFRWSNFPNAPNVNFTGGEIAGGFKTVVWFVVPSVTTPGKAQLNRVVYDVQNGAPAGPISPAMGSLVATDIEAMRVEAWEWVPVNPPLGMAIGWNRVDINNLSNQPNRLRVDIELVVRARVPGERRFLPVNLRIPSGTPAGCVPNIACPGPPVDLIERRVLRTSVEIKNSGRMQPQN